MMVPARSADVSPGVGLVGAAADHTLSGAPACTRRAVARAIPASTRAPPRAVASTPRLAAEAWVHRPRAGMRQAGREVKGMARVNAAASHSRCTDALAPPRRKAQAMLPKKAP